MTTLEQIKETASAEGIGVNLVLKEYIHFLILDYFKTKNQELYDFSKEASFKDKDNAKMLYKICIYLMDYMKMSGLRDYSDQVIDCIKFFCIAVASRQFCSFPTVLYPIAMIRFSACIREPEVYFHCHPREL